MKLWKKFLASVTAGVLCVGGVGLSGVESVQESMGTVLSANASVPVSYDGRYEGLYYNVTDTGEIEIAGCYKYVRKVNIPIEIDGKSVTSIEDYAFSDCTGLTEITIPDSVTSIGEQAFFCCTGLTEITIPDSVTSIGVQAFSYCTSLTEITIPDSVTSIGGYAFWRCTSLTEITILDSVTSIGRQAFSNCTRLKNVYISDINAWFEIDFVDSASNPMCHGANLYCNGELVTEVAIPDSMESIGSYVFADCTSLTEITIPDSVTSIGEYAFSGCTSLTEITIPDSVTSIGWGAFEGCTSLTEITIPDSVTSIRKGTFSGCTSLKSVTFLGSKTGIEEGAFRNCDADMKFITEDTCGYVVSVVENVTQLTVKPKEGKIPAGAYKGNKRLKEVTLEEGITLIEDDAFANCDNLEKIVIPKSVTVIRYTAFTYDTKLTMYGYKGTYAERYAEMLGFPFVALDDSDTPPVTTTTTTSTTETTPTTAAPITGGLVCGDINLDGRVDITDAVLLNKFCSGAITLDDTAKKNADCNGDGEPGSGDAVVLLQFLVHIVDTLPYSA